MRKALLELWFAFPGGCESPRASPVALLPAGIDILKLVAAQVGSQWKDIYQFLCNASEREVAAFSNGYAADHERAYAALQHWTIRGPEASLAQLISALRQHRRNDVVEKIRGLMEDTTAVRLGMVLTCLVHCLVC